MSEAHVTQLIAWNDTGVELPRRPLSALLRDVADAHPESVAVRDATRSLTYAEFAAEVHRTAWYLKERGLEPGDMVAVSLPRGVQAVLTQAALFTLGAVYVPVDVEYPADLLTGVIDHVGARFLLTRRSHVINAEAERIDLDAPSTRRDIAARSTEALGRDPDLADLAYVIHTSGTSGRPKPVAVSHGAIANSTLARLHRYPRRVERFGLVSPMTFDSSLAGIWWTLLCGGELRLLPPCTPDAITELPRVLKDISHVVLTPSLHRILLSTVDEPGALTTVVVAGEACPPDLVTEHHEKLPGVELINEYGPTEAAVWCSGATLRPGDDVVVGTPIANTELWVVADGRLAAPGELGEVCVGGANLADGYLHDPGLTGERFVRHPLDPGRRVYRTGDLGRWTSTGQLELKGRIDDQLKVRGHRIEPDGVAAALRSHPNVRDAVITQRNGLVAYVVTDEPLRDLRAHAARTLAEHERPTAYVVLDELPLTAHGKVDHAALPAPTGRPDLSTPYAPPARSIEVTIAAILGELLNVDQVGRHDDFAELGGDSLLAVTAAGRLSEHFEVELPARTVMDLPTVAELAELLLSCTVLRRAGTR